MSVRRVSWPAAVRVVQAAWSHSSPMSRVPSIARACDQPPAPLCRQRPCPSQVVSLYTGSGPSTRVALR